jgi:hypothetical protein
VAAIQTQDRRLLDTAAVVVMDFALHDLLGDSSELRKTWKGWADRPEVRVRRFLVPSEMHCGHIAAPLLVAARAPYAPLSHRRGS